MTNWRLSDHMTHYRHHYSKTVVEYLAISRTKDNQLQIHTSFKDRKTYMKTVPTGCLNKVIRSLKPRRLTSFDHDELADMSRLWWKDVGKRCSTHFNGCEKILVESKLSKNLTDILKPMTTKNLEWFVLYGDGDLECSKDDLMKIGKLSKKLDVFQLYSVSESSNITNDDILDMLEIGSFSNSPNMYISRIENFGNMEECLKKREWVKFYECESPRDVVIESNNGISFGIVTGKIPNI